MKKLSKSARVTEVDDTSDRLLQIFAQEVPLKDEAFLKPLYAELKLLSDKITEVIKKDKVLSDLEDADAVRDEAVRNLFKIIEGYAAMPLPNLRQAGATLKAVLWGGKQNI